MTTPTLPPQKPDDPRGWLCFDAPLPEPWQSAEDSTQHHDYRGWSSDWVAGYDPDLDSEYVDRPATSTEIELLTALGYTVPDGLLTRVSFPSPLVRRRRWPALETPEVVTP